MTNTKTNEMINIVPRFNREEMLLGELLPWIDGADNLLGSFTSTFEQGRALLDEYKGRNIELIIKLYNALDDLVYLHCVAYGKDINSPKTIVVDNVGCIVDSFYDNQYLATGVLEGADIFKVIEIFKREVDDNEYSVQLLKEELESLFDKEFFEYLLAD